MNLNNDAGTTSTEKVMPQCPACETELTQWSPRCPKCGFDLTGNFLRRPSLRLLFVCIVDGLILGSVIGVVLGLFGAWGYGLDVLFPIGAIGGTVLGALIGVILTFLGGR